VQQHLDIGMIYIFIRVHPKVFIIQLNRTLTFEFYMSYFEASNQYYHFQIVFFENKTIDVQGKTVKKICHTYYR
jgi:hypothetical protein